MPDVYVVSCWFCCFYLNSAGFYSNMQLNYLEPVEYFDFCFQALLEQIMSILQPGISINFTVVVVMLFYVMHLVLWCLYALVGTQTILSVGFWNCSSCSFLLILSLLLMHFCTQPETLGDPFAAIWDNPSCTSLLFGFLPHKFQLP